MTMVRAVVLFLALVAAPMARGFRLPFASRSRTASQVVMSDSTSSSVQSIVDEPKYASVAVSGFISKATEFAEPYLFSKLHDTGKWGAITSITDDLKFARKRFVNPSTVYSGLLDVLKFVEVGAGDHGSLEAALAGQEVWVAYGVTSADLPAYAALAAKLKLKRAVFAVRVEGAERGADVAFDAPCEVLRAAGVDYTIVKYGEVRTMAEAKYPYRIVRGVLPLPAEGEGLSTGDLWRILAEVVDLPKAFNAVYGVGPGTMLDAEILVYMKAQGWPERVQVGMLVGDMMEKIEERWSIEQQKKEAKAAAAATPVKKAPTDAAALPGGDGNKFAGFF
jgi:hypothetical protein